MTSLSAATKITADKFLQQEANRCLLCYQAACTQACPKGQDPGRACLQLHFGSAQTAAPYLAAEACLNCSAPCLEACPVQPAIRLPELAIQLQPRDQLPGRPIQPEQLKAADLSVRLPQLGLRAANPFLLSSSVVASNYEMCARALKQGWAGLVYKTSGFVRSPEVSPRFDALMNESGHFEGFRNLEQISEHSPEEDFAALRQLKDVFPDKLIVASVMGQTETEWTRLCAMAEASGCDMIELNFSCPHMSAHGLGSDVGEDPKLVEAFTQAARRGTRLPLMAKMTPNLAHIAIPARAAVQGGADALAAINTVKSLSGFNWTSILNDQLTARPSIAGSSSVSGYSGRAVKPLALRFIYDLASDPLLRGVPLSATGGIVTWQDALDFILLGSGLLQITTAVMQYGYRIIDGLTAGLAAFVLQQQTTVQELLGQGLPLIKAPDQLDRTSTVYPSFHREHCVGCGRCYLSCADGGHQALSFGPDRQPRLDARRCVGCGLCSLVCPSGAIQSSRRVPRRN
ncbi:NAD-dependent dihydropyrimidine dehydrogenase subunit PreA [Oscillospiraceae bacterium HV4-5-C5C]|nr:NAD-dependent dihydropyrimidine dehydrogenase subunit PreA [Oscillospiraceae bacterium HV4-5-C5C]